MAKHEASSLAYQKGELQIADNILSQAISDEMPSGNFKKSENAVCLLLNRAMTRFVNLDIKGAIADYELSIQALDYYAQDSTLETAGQILIEDGCSAYRGADFEHVLARIYFALALLHKGDYSNAYAVLRQAEEFQQRKRERYSSIPYMADVQLCDNSFGKYLFAMLLENRGDKSNAAILYQQAQVLSGSSPKCINLQSEQATSSATVLLVCHNGNVPFKISATSSASVASAIALEILLSSQRVDPAFSSLPGIPVPVLCQKVQSEPTKTYALINDTSIPIPPYFDVAWAAHTELEQKKPLIVARGVARFLIRRSAVACFQRQDPTLGALMDLGMLVANASTKADTRSWSTLPSSVDLARCSLSPGQHCIRICAQGQGPLQAEHSIPIKLRANDLCVINIFNIHPGITTILVPPQFKITGDDL